LRDLGKCKFRPYKIKLTSDVPIYHYPYKMSEKELLLIDDQVKDMLDAGIIRHSESPYSSRVFLVPKPNNEKRFVVNFKPVNEITEPTHFIIPDINIIIYKLKDAVWFSILDLKAGYFQIILSEDSIPITAFTTRLGHFEFLVLPFGLRNAVIEFCKIMHALLGHLPFVIVYVDDITIFSKTLNEHLEHIKVVLDILKKNDLKLNKQKCKFFQREIKCLGYIISFNKIAMNPDKIIAIQNFLEPKNVKQLQSFLGLANYYSKFINNFAN